MVYIPVAGAFLQIQVDDRPAPLPGSITPNFASTMRMKSEGGVVSEGGNPDVQDADKSLNTTQDLSRLDNSIVVGDENKLPSRILSDNAFNDTLPSSENRPEASRDSFVLALRFDALASR